MKQVTLPGDVEQNIVVDVCEPCGWVLIEYFDGEPTHVARAMAEAELAPPARSMASPPESPMCPECQKPFQLLPYLEDGPAVFRCTQCLAVLASADQISALAAFTHDPHDEEQGGLFAFLRRLFD